MRPLRSWPTWKLRLALMFPFWRRVWGAAWIELWHRSDEEVHAATALITNDEGGPWLVAPPRGFH